MATRIIKIGMDVHSTNYTLCALESRWNEPPLLHARIQVEPETQFVLKFIETIQEKIGEECEIICGYEAGCLGDSLYRDLKKENIECVIMAPTTMSKSPIKGKKKSDYRDANDIAELLISGGYHAVYVLTENDAAVKEYIRMRDDHKSMVKQTKQRINALVLRSGKQFSGSSWTGAHIEWLKKLEFGHAATREILNEYLVTLDMLEAHTSQFNLRREREKKLVKM